MSGVDTDETDTLHDDGPTPPLSIDHYYPEYTLPVLVDDTLFRLPGSVMAQRSLYIRHAMQQMHLLPSVYYEDSRAIRIDILHRREFSVLLDYMLLGKPFDDENADEYPEELLISILEVSSKLGVKDGRNLAIKLLGDIKGWDPAKQCSLAVRFKIPDWFDNACSRLVSESLSNLTCDQCCSLGCGLLHDLIQVRAKVDRLRLSLACDTPSCSANIACQTMDLCYKSWLALWREVMTEHLRSNIKLLGSRAEELIFTEHRNKHHKAVCDDCLEYYLAEVSRKGYFAKERILLDDEVGRLARTAMLPAAYTPFSEILD